MTDLYNLVTEEVDTAFELLSKNTPENALGAVLDAIGRMVISKVSKALQLSFEEVEALESYVLQDEEMAKEGTQIDFDDIVKRKAKKAAEARVGFIEAVIREPLDQNEIDFHARRIGLKLIQRLHAVLPHANLSEIARQYEQMEAHNELRTATEEKMDTLKEWLSSALRRISPAERRLAS